MLVKSVQPTSRKPVRRNPRRIQSEPAYLSAKLREVALRTYHAVRTAGDARAGNGSAGPKLVFHSPSRHDWDDLHSEIVQLERTLDAQRLDSLAAYVAALRQEVENRLV
jgi:hypothetical protein